MTIGNKIKNRRKELGMSAEELADVIEVSPSTIYRYESGDIENMGVEKIVPIAKALSVSEAYLMGWLDPRPENDVCDTLQGLLRELHDDEIELTFKGHKIDEVTRQLLIQQIDNAISICNINIFTK